MSDDTLMKMIRLTLGIIFYAVPAAIVACAIMFGRMMAGEVVNMHQPATLLTFILASVALVIVGIWLVLSSIRQSRLSRELVRIQNIDWSASEDKTA